MNDSVEKLAERRGYAKGYAAGNARKKRETQHAEKIKQENAFWQRAFLAALPAAFAANNWTRGDKAIKTLSDRVRLASETADEALKAARQHL